MALHASEHRDRLCARPGDRLVIRVRSLGEPAGTLRFWSRSVVGARRRSESAGKTTVT
jgi:hypothetical protein